MFKHQSIKGCDNETSEQDPKSHEESNVVGKCFILLVSLEVLVETIEQLLVSTLLFHENIFVQPFGGEFSWVNEFFALSFAFFSLFSLFCFFLFFSLSFSFFGAMLEFFQWQMLMVSNHLNNTKEWLQLANFGKMACMTKMSSRTTTVKNDRLANWLVTL